MTRTKFENDFFGFMKFWHDCNKWHVLQQMDNIVTNNQKLCLSNKNAFANTDICRYVNGLSVL
jgi:hypothetical protein